MKATIIKNDEFVTIGLIVKHAEVTLFTWGVTYAEGHYSKTINADEYTAQVMELIQLEQMRRYYGSGISGHFVGDVFEIAGYEQNKAKRKRGDNGSIYFGEYNNKEDEYKAKIEAIVNKIK